MNRRSEPPTVMVSGWGDGLSVFRGGDVRREFEGRRVAGLASDDAGRAYAIVGEAEVWAWSPQRPWRPAMSGDGTLVCCMTVGNRLLAGTEDARVLELSAEGWAPLTGLDATPGRESWYAGTAVIDGQLVGPPLGIRSMTKTCDEGALLVNVHVGGIPRSTDSGVTWRPTIDIDADVHQVAAHPSRTEIVAAAAAAGLCVSRDGGLTWSVTTDGLHASYCSAVALTETDLYLAASTDHFAGQGAVYRRKIECDGPLELVGRGLPAWLDGIVDSHCIAVQGDDLAIVDRGGNLYVSRDGGDSWSLLADGLPVPSGVLIC